MIRKKKLDVVRGGIAIPIPNKDNYYYMSGRKHINGGIDLGKDPKTGLEVEDGEVVKIGKNDIKVFSSVPFQNGKSPAERVLGGENASTVFKEQEAFKYRNGLNDDGTKKKKLGGNIIGLYSITSNGETRLRPFPSTGSLPRIRRKAALGIFDDDDETSQNNETDMSTTNNKPLKTTTLKEIVITPKNVENETEKRIAKNEKRNRLINSYLSGYHGDAINLLSNIGGNIATTLINRRALNKMQAPPQPISKTAAKLRTNYNINPQLDNLRETAARYEEAVNNNTASSRTALARNQQNRFATALNTNTLYGTKENEETKLINADRLNQQEVANKNVEAYNAWQDKVNAFKNAITEKKAENLVGLTQGITSGITSTIENVQQRMRDDKSILANALSHPNLPIEEFYHNGLISKRAYDAYRKAYPLKTDTKKED